MTEVHPEHAPLPSRYSDGACLGHNPDWGDAEATWKAAQVLGMMRRHQLEPRSICDLGCGTAGVLDELDRHLPGDIRLVGYERIELRGEDARACSDHFDLVLLLDVIEHVDDYMGFLRAVRTVGDRFILHIPLDMTVQAVLRMKPILGVRESWGHLHYFSAETALAVLSETGYRVVDHTYTRGGIEVAPKRFRTRVAAAPRRLAHAISPRLAARVLGGFSLLVLAEPS